MNLCRPRSRPLYRFWYLAGGAVLVETKGEDGADRMQEIPREIFDRDFEIDTPAPVTDAALQRLGDDRAAQSNAAYPAPKIAAPQGLTIIDPSLD